MAERQPRSDRPNVMTVPCDMFISRAAPQRGLNNLVLLLVIVCQSSHGRYPGNGSNQPCSVSEP